MYLNLIEQLALVQLVLSKYVLDTDYIIVKNAYPDLVITHPHFTINHVTDDDLDFLQNTCGVVIQHDLITLPMVGTA